MRILVLNAGSSTLKASVIDTPGRDALASETVEWRQDATEDERADAVRGVLGAIGGAGVAAGDLRAVGHRIVHGGTRFTQPVVVDDAVVAEIDALSDLAPLHNPLAASTLRAARRVLPEIPHVAAFDTAFHATLPVSAVRYPVPEAWQREHGVRRFGFHGLSVGWATRRAAELLDAGPDTLRLVVAHLGSGCSVTAVDGATSAWTSMGMTPLEGLMMGTRAGSLDPGIIFRLLRRGVAADEVEAALEHGSGLAGVAGVADVRALLEREGAGDADASLALELFVARAAAGIAAAATALPSLDALVLTGGIGENSVEIGRRICARLTVLGLAEPNDATADAVVARAPGRPSVLRVRAREDVEIARAAADTLGGR